jgi:hypothetical protein
VDRKSATKFIVHPHTLSLFDRRYLSDEIVERTVVFWAPASKAVGAKRQRMLGSLVLAEQAVKVDDTQALPVLLKVWQGNHESWTTSSWLHAAELATPCLTPEQ